MNPWLLLGVSILAEVAGTTALKLSDGFTRPLYTLLVPLFYGASFYVFSGAVRYLDLGLAYAIWAGLGTVCIALLSVVFFGESMNVIKLVSMTAIVAGVIGLNLASGHAAA